MLSLTGFVVADESNRLIAMPLSKDIQNGTGVDNPIPVFTSIEDAMYSWLMWCTLYVGDRKGKVCEITTSGLQPVKDLVYSETDD